MITSDSHPDSLLWRMVQRRKIARSSRTISSEQQRPGILMLLALSCLFSAILSSGECYAQSDKLVTLGITGEMLYPRTKKKIEALNRDMARIKQMVKKKGLEKGTLKWQQASTKYKAVKVKRDELANKLRLIPVTEIQYFGEAAGFGVTKTDTGLVNVSQRILTHLRSAKGNADIGKHICVWLEFKRIKWKVGPCSQVGRERCNWVGFWNSPTASRSIFLWKVGEIYKGVYRGGCACLIFRTYTPDGLRITGEWYNPHAKPPTIDRGTITFAMDAGCNNITGGSYDYNFKAMRGTQRWHAWGGFTGRIGGRARPRCKQKIATVCP